MTTIWFSKLNSEEKNDEETPFNPFARHTISLFGKPKEIGHFSIDANRKIHFNKSMMKYLVTNLRTQDVNLDLNIGYKNDFIHPYVTLEKMHQILYWIMEKNIPLNVNFITVRGTLTRIMCTPYMHMYYKSHWEICASKFNGIIYFAAIDTEIDLRDNSSECPKLLQFQYWGHKFEQYLTTDHIDGELDISSSVHHLEEYCIILKNKLNDFTLLYQAEIDAVTPYIYPGPDTGDTSCYVELKTSKILSRTSDVFKFCSQKLALWWAQSYLTGIPDIICGRRTNDGIIKALDIYKVNNIPQQGFGLWSSEACLSFCDTFLRQLKKIVVEDNPNIVYTFSYRNEEMIYCKKLINPDEKYKIIPEWYKKFNTKNYKDVI